MVATSTSPLERLKKPFRFEDLQKPFKLEDFLVVIEAEKARENAREKRERLEDIRQGAIVLERENNALKNKIIQLTEEEIGSLRSDLPPPEIISMLREKLEKDKEEVREGTRLGASEVRETISGVAESAEEIPQEQKPGLLGWIWNKITGKKEATALATIVTGNKPLDWAINISRNWGPFGKPLLWLFGISLGALLGWKKFINKFNGGKNADEIKQLEQKMKFLEKCRKDGFEAAVKEFGQDILQGVTGGIEAGRESRNILTGGGSILGAIAGSTLLGKIFPKIAPKIGGLNERTFLKNCAKSFFLKGFGIGGIVLFGLGTLAEVIEKPEFRAKNGEMPSNPDKQGEYLEKALSESNLDKSTLGIIRAYLSKGADVLTGKKLDEFLDENLKRPPEGFVTLEEKMQPLFEKCKDLAHDCEKMGDKLYPLLALGLVSSSLVRKLAWGGTNLGLLGLKMFLVVGGLIGENILKTLFLILAITHGSAIAGHMIIVPKGKKEFEEWLTHILSGEGMQMEDQNTLKEAGINAEAFSQAQGHVSTISEVVHDPNKIDPVVGKEIKKARNKLGNILTDIVAPEREKVIQDRTERGFEWFLSEINVLHNPTSTEKEIKKHVEQFISFIKSGGKITEPQLKTLNSITEREGSRITLYSYRDVIRWRIQKDHELSYTTGYLCVNPKITDINEAYHLARKLPINREGWLGGIAAGVGEGFTGKLRSSATELREALEKNDTKKGASALQKCIENGGTIMWHMGKFILVDGYGKAMLLPFTSFIPNTLALVQGKLPVQEFIIETVDGLAPIMVIGAVANAGKGLGIPFFRAVLESPLYYIGLGSTKQRQLGRFIFERFADGKMKLHSMKYIEEVVKISFTSKRFRFLERLKSRGLLIPSLVPSINQLRRCHVDLADLDKLESLLKQAKVAQSHHLNSTAKRLTEQALHLSEEMAKIRGDKQIRHLKGLKFSIGELDRTLGIIGIRKTGIAKEVGLLNKGILGGLAKLKPSVALSGLSGSRLRYARGLGILALFLTPVAASAATSALNERETSLERAGRQDWLENITEDTEETEGDETIDPTEQTRASIESSKRKTVFEKLLTIQEKYNEQITSNEELQSVLNRDENWYRNHDETDLKRVLGAYFEIYNKACESTREIAQDRKEELLEYFRTSDLGEKQVVSFMVGHQGRIGIGCQRGNLQLRYASQEKIQADYYYVFDLIKDKYWTHEDGSPTAGTHGMKLLWSLTPGVGTYIDGRQAWRDFSRGNIKSGLINTGFATLSGVADVILLTGVGAGLSAAIKGGVMGLKELKMARAAYVAAKEAAPLAKYAKIAHGINFGGGVGVQTISASDASKFYDKTETVF